MRYFLFGILGYLFHQPLLAQLSDSVSKEEKWSENVRLTALMDSRTAIQFNNGSIQKSELIFRPELEVLLSKKIRFVAIGRLYSEFTDRLEPGKPIQDEVIPLSRRVLIEDIVEMELREFYFDFKLGKHYLTLGKQQIVWGKTDGLKILDVVNPINLREFFLDDFDYSRIPLWSVKADLNLNALKAQLIWIPDNSNHDLPNQSYPFFPSAFFSQSNGDIPVVQRPLQRPDQFWKDSDVGVRLSSFISGWDVTLNYLYKFDDFPIAVSVLHQNPTELEVLPTYKRYHLLGASFSNAFKSFTIRGEIGFYSNRFFMTDTPQDGGVFSANQLSGAIGLDFSGFTNTLISTQFFLDNVFSGTPIVGRQQLESNLTLLASRNFHNETITVDCILVQNINVGDGFVRPKIKWMALNNLSISAGSDIIYGDKTRLFGQFQNLSRATLQLQLGI